MRTTSATSFRAVFLIFAAFNVLIFLLLLLLFFYGYNANKDRIHDLRSESHTRCEATEQTKKVLHLEHKAKLNQAKKFLHKHPHGVNGISRTDVLLSIQGERTIIRQTRPIPCP